MIWDAITVLYVVQYDGSLSLCLSLCLCLSLSLSVSLSLSLSLSLYIYIYIYMFVSHLDYSPWNGYGFPDAYLATPHDDVFRPVYIMCTPA